MRGAQLRILLLRPLAQLTSCAGEEVSRDERGLSGRHCLEYLRVQHARFMVRWVRVQRYFGKRQCAFELRCVLQRLRFCDDRIAAAQRDDVLAMFLARCREHL